MYGFKKMRERKKITYVSDESQGTHCLIGAKYGQGGPREWGRWVLLEE